MSVVNEARCLTRDINKDEVDLVTGPVNLSD